MAGVKGQKGTGSTEVANKFEETFLEAMDGRAATTRNLRQRFGALVSDLGGLATLSYQEQSLIRRIVHMERHVEKKELSLAHGKTIDENSYLATVNCLSGLLSKIGLRRRARQLPSLSEYLANGKPPADPMTANGSKEGATTGPDAPTTPQPQETTP